MNVKASRRQGIKARSDREPSLAPSPRRAFTLTELMVAVAVLIVVIIATSKIFGTASKITGIGQATASVMTEAAAIEQQLREDIAKLTTEGFFAIRCIAVQNDVNGAAAPLLNPNLPPTAMIRSDQLVFFANGVSSMQAFRPSADLLVRAQDLTSRIYWGHAFQLRNASPALIAGTSGSGIANKIHAHDPQPIIYNPLTAAGAFPAPQPWFRGNTTMGTNLFGTFGGIGTSGAGNDMFGPANPAAGPNSINGNQPEARQWLLARQSVLLINDDDHITDWYTNYKTIWPDAGGDPHVTARSIFINNTANLPWGWSREIRNGRLDSAASELDQIRRWVLYNKTDHMPAPTPRRPWTGGVGNPPNDQRTVIQSAVYWPRAERRAPSANRIDQALTNHVIGSACSSFAIDWTYDDGVGAVLDASGNVVVAPNGTTLFGIGINPGVEHPWFGLTDATRGVDHYAAWPTNMDPMLGRPAATILPINTFPNNVETATFGAALPAGVQDYWAVFGYNRTEPLDPVTGNPWSATPPVAVAYTPFPSAIRVTMTLHDPEGRLEGGREFQFVIKLPKRAN